MEINLENAFSLIFRVTYGIIIPYMDNMYNKVAEYCNNIIKWLLKRPILATIVSVSVFVMLSGVVTFSLIVIFGVVCFVSSIILFQGLIFVGVFLVVISLITILLALAMSFYIVQTLCLRDESDEEHDDIDVFL